MSSEVVEEYLSRQALIAELVRLRHKLQFSAKEYRGATGSNRRPAVRLVLNALSEFLSNVYALDQDLRQPINDLLYGLYDLDRGRVVALLEPAELNHRPPLASSDALFRASAAAIMDLHQQDGMTRDQAASRTAIKLNELGYRDGSGQRITANNVKRWRDQMKERQGEKDIASERYAVLLSELASKYPQEPGKALQFLLDVLSDLNLPEIP